MKYFVVSDVHGCYTEMVEALETAGFDPQNPQHTLVTAGDMFDRGWENHKVFNYLISLPNVINVIGNHDIMLLEFLNNPTGHTSIFNIMHNGLSSTLENFAGVSVIRLTALHEPEELINVKEAIRKNYGKLFPWLHNHVAMFETDTHIVVHAALDADPTADYHDTPLSTMTWDIDFMHQDTSHINKTIVFGHMHAMKLRKAITGANDSTSKTFYYENKVAIDGCTNLTGNVNVYVWEED